MCPGLRSEAGMVRCRLLWWPGWEGHPKVAASHQGQLGLPLGNHGCRPEAPGVSGSSLHRMSHSRVGWGADSGGYRQRAGELRAYLPLPLVSGVEFLGRTPSIPTTASLLRCSKFC